MYVRVDASPGEEEISLEEADDCTRFHVAPSEHASAGDVDRLLRANHAGAMSGDGDALVSVAWVRGQAEDAVAPDWAARFQAMLDFARTKGWTSEDGQEIRAHLQWG